MVENGAGADAGQFLGDITSCLTDERTYPIIVLNTTTSCLFFLRKATSSIIASHPINRDNEQP
jgi:hypothetical protein